MSADPVDPGSTVGPDGRIGADRAHALASSGQVVLVDIRTPAEWAQTGVPAVGALIALTDSSQRLRTDFVGDLDRLLEGARERPVALICRSGGRSAFARRLLLAEGFSAVLDVAEGMSGSSHGPGWLARGLPVRRWTSDDDRAPMVTAASR